MSVKQEIHDFLTSRRAKITPDAAGLKVYGENRRVKGLRREEVALLAGISIDYYKRIERGNAGMLSESVFKGLVHALQLDDAASDYLRQLLQTASGAQKPASTEAPQDFVRPAVAQALDAMPFPAYIRNNRFDILTANELGQALYSPIYDFAPGQTPNAARFLFLAPQAADFFRDYQETTLAFAAVLRSEVGRAPNDAALRALVDELETSSERFVQAWELFDISYHCPGPKNLCHPIIGNMTLNYEVFDLPNDSGQRMNMYTCEAGSPAAAALAQLESYTVDS